jgi:exo-beta-1,3-glucanase (GH17 family)/cellulose synthase/poly-beta-1,6-N-acetylglucosamine synthase-like glycosyltransferase
MLTGASRNGSAPGADRVENVIPGQSLGAFLIAALMAIIAAGAWGWMNQPVQLPDVPERISGFAYSGFQRSQDPTEQLYPSADELSSDLALLGRQAEAIRTYSSIDNANVPRLASDHGLLVTAGAWLDRRSAHNEDEIAALIRAVKENSNIERVIVGNEAILRGDVTVADLIKKIKLVKRKVRVPVSTAEPWHIWLKYPELAKQVEFITVHLLPYWEGLTTEDALEYVFDRFDDLRAAYPNKKIVIGEIGWPSRGDRVKGALASPIAQARFMREFLVRAAQRNLDYFVLEAFDQPWKTRHEGRAGAYWGMFFADRTPKFSLSGPVVPDPAWPRKALASVLLAVPFMFWFALAFRRIRLGGRIFFCALIQSAASLGVWLVTMPFEFYLRPIDMGALALIVPAMIATIAVLLVNGFEFVEILWHREWSRRFLPYAGARGSAPLVSVHVPCCNEPPAMVILTLESMARLDYENFEVLVIDNNTRDEATWRPVEAWCKAAGSRFRFFHLDNWPGFKAGALNFALKHTNPHAEVIGVVDADYEVAPGWLKTLTPHFEDPKVAVVQAPQAHRGFEHSAFQRMCNWEFDGFFRIGMHHRNERNAIIQHGTMTLVRKTSLAMQGGWAEWCICEDAELGLRLMHAGYETRYVDAVCGRGLAPADFKTFKAQRYRWAFGAMQILKRHWRWLATERGLSGGQRYHFVTGWFSWFADALHLVFVFAALAWTAGMVADPQHFSLPLNLFMGPVLAFFAIKAMFGPVLYRARVACSWFDVLGASLAAMGLSHAIARGIWQGLARKDGTFKPTMKGVTGTHRPSTFAVVREEALLLLALALAAVAVIWRMGANHPEAMLWVGLLAAQAIPYMAALGCGWISQRSFARTAHVSIELGPVDGSGTGRNLVRMPALAADSARAAQTAG